MSNDFILLLTAFEKFIFLKRQQKMTNMIGFYRYNGIMNKSCLIGDLILHARH